jgi:hypothetical protein
MKTPHTKSPPAASKARRPATHPAARQTQPNATLNQQNRKVLAQHYRAKYGVK